MEVLMKKQLIFVFIFTLLFSQSLFAEESLILATGEWQPFTTQSMENKGFVTEIVTQVLKLMNIKAEIKFYPWRRCYEYVLQDKVWAAFPYSYTEERAKEVLFSDDLAFSTTKFFFYSKTNEKPSFVYNQLEDLRQYKVGGVIGYYYEEQFKSAKLNVDFVSKESSALEKLFLGRTQLLPLNVMVGWELIKKTFPDNAHQFGMLEKPLDKKSLKLILNKNNKNTLDLLKKFNNHLEKFKKGQHYQSILQKYIGS
ncbi:Extracellular solute-binding protein, family 3 [Candidatus Magnetomorum sp. HK-1]|nr:Extracellular solute-binding protein, family 3 [Candidatus Magnetomorum sp. HK-1]